MGNQLHNLLSCLCFAAIIIVNGCARSAIVPGAKIIKVDQGVAHTSYERQRLSLSDDESLFGAAAIYKLTNTEVLFFMLSGDYCFRYRDLAKEGTVGILRRGNGPDEMPGALPCSIWSEGEGQLFFSAYSIETGTYVEIDLSGSLTAGKTIVTSKTSLPATTFYAHRVGDGIGCYVFSHSQELSWKRIRDGEIQEEWEPFNTEGLNPQEQFFAGTAVSADGKYLVMGMTAFPRLYIFDLETGRKLAVAPDMHGDAQVRAYLQKNLHPQKEYYNGVVIEGDKVCAMYLDPAPSIQVFDFEGKLLNIIDIPDMLANFIVVDGAIIGITMDGEVFRYEEK